jgi:hypothetical protein
VRNYLPQVRLRFRAIALWKKYRHAINPGASDVAQFGVVITIFAEIGLLLIWIYNWAYTPCNEDSATNGMLVSDTE